MCDLTVFDDNLEEEYLLDTNFDIMDPTTGVARKTGNAYPSRVHDPTPIL